jgi:hypothetical protein
VIVLIYFRIQVSDELANDPYIVTVILYIFVNIVLNKLEREIVLIITRKVLFKNNN